MPGLKYDELPDPNNYLRLITFAVDTQPGNGDFRCTLSTFAMTEAPAYSAVSYTWGSASETTTIIIDDTTVNVRRSCRSVLQQALALDSERYYWVDAICINQENITERSAQVQQMGRIFASAERVNACIGEHADDSLFVMRTMQTFPSVRLDPLTAFGTRAWAFMKALKWLLSRRRIDVARLVDGVTALLRRPYFQRVWVIQEVFSKQYRTLLCCGSDQLLFQKLFMLAHLLRAAAMNDDYNHRRLSYLFAFESFKSFVNMASGNKLVAIDRRYHFYDFPHVGPSFMIDVSFQGRRVSNRLSGFTTEDGKDGLEQMIGMLKYFQCYDPRDRVYGIIDLIDWEGDEPIETNYRKSTFQVALEVLLHGWHRGRHKTMGSIMDLLLGFRSSLCGEHIVGEVLDYRASLSMAESEGPMSDKLQHDLFGLWCKIDGIDEIDQIVDRGEIQVVAPGNENNIRAAPIISRIAVVLRADDFNGFHSDIRISASLMERTEGVMSLHGVFLEHGTCRAGRVATSTSDLETFDVRLCPEDALVIAIMILCSYQSDVATHVVKELGRSLVLAPSSTLLTTVSNNSDVSQLDGLHSLCSWQNLEREKPEDLNAWPRLAWKIRT